ncbi:MAG: nitrilase-related carbon-nitrogen hydrolase [Solirubrobacteraceae bacterium]
MKVGVVSHQGDAAGRHGIHVAAGGIVEPIHGSKRVYDAAVLLDPQGREIARYRRVHVHDAEAATIGAGSELGLAQTPFGSVGLSIGYDLCFPELYRSLALEGARAILHTGAGQDELLLRARAVENGVFMVAAGMVVDPAGAVVARAGEREATVVADIDLSCHRPAASLRHRRPAVYRPLAADSSPAVPPTRAGDGATLSYYQRGATSLFASRSDQRFSWCLYVPSDYDEDAETTYPLAVVVHGTTRTAQRYRDEFAAFGERHGCIVLAPLFPCGIVEPGDLDNYKRIEYRDIRFDRVLLDIVDEVSETYRIEAERFLLHGFSGGGHFAHRFFYLHPDRLLGVSIGAPGMITLIDPAKPWWIGTRDLEERFGIALRLEEMREVAVQMVIGGEDTTTWEINNRDSPGWMDGADAAGRTRLERLGALRKNYERAGIGVQYDIVPGVAHDGYRVLEPVRRFFAASLARTRGEVAR